MSLTRLLAIATLALSTACVGGRDYVLNQHEVDEQVLDVVTRVSLNAIAFKTIEEELQNKNYDRAQTFARNKLELNAKKLCDYKQMLTNPNMMNPDTADILLFDINTTLGSISYKCED